MPHTIEENGIKLLIKTLSTEGHVVERTSGTFDLKVKGKPAEVKTKGSAFAKLDFISLTKKQYLAARREDYDIYIVCNLKKGVPEIYKINSRQLLTKNPSVITSYEYSRKKIASLRPTLLKSSSKKL